MSHCGTTTKWQAPWPRVGCEEPSSTAEFRRLRLSPGPTSVEETGAEVDYPVAAPAELRTPNLHRAKIAQQKSADGRMATEAARLRCKKNTGRKKEKPT
jgi:hypothetical protein